MSFDREAYDVESDIELNPYYNEIEFILSEYDSQTDPLDVRESTFREVDWYHIRKHAEMLLSQCFDLRVALWLMRANFHIDGIAALYQGLVFIDTQYADDSVTVYPKIEADQPSDSIHAAALGWLATTSCLHEIKSCLIFPEIPLKTDGLLNLRLAEQDGKSLNYSEVVKVIGQANAFFAANQLPSLQEQLSLGGEALARIENYVNHYADGYRLDCRHVRDYLQIFLRFLASLEQQGLPTDIEDEGITQAAEDSLISVPLATRQIRSRQDVILVLDQVLDYFQHHEPSHPAPIFIRRSQKMVGMDFTTLVEELLPEASSSLQQLAGK